MVIPVPVEVPHETKNDTSYRKELGFDNKFVFGMHQRNDKNIFSPIPLEAYEEIQTDETAFLILVEVIIIENRQRILN